MKRIVHAVCHIIFWGWNVCALIWIYLLLLPLLGGEFFEATVMGAIPFTLTLSFLALMFIPVVCTIVGFKYFRKWPVLLMRLFYGVEAPLVGLCVVRLFLLREMTLLATGLMAALTFGMITFALELKIGYAASRRRLAVFQLVAHSLVLLMGLYVGTLLLFYTIPVLCWMVYGVITTVIPEFFRFQWLSEAIWAFGRNPTIVLSILMWLFLFGFSCALFVVMPFAFSNMYIRSWARIASAFGKQYSRRLALRNTVLTAIAACTLFTIGVIQPQPQIAAFQLLEPVPQTIAARQAVLDQSETIREGLVNAYLFRYRYLSPRRDVNGLQNLYHNLLGISPEWTKPLQTLHNGLIAPFLYQGSNADPGKAKQLYAQVFDTPIQKAEAEAVQHALRATANREQAQAGLLNINQRIVQLTSQTVTVQEHGDWAEVEIHERYENDTPLNQEVFYAFSLPESAVITGLWLGNDANPKTFEFVVSPRGAAQQVYTQEVQWNVDPALLEQVGPRQYRLRAFPVPGQVTLGKPGHLHVVLTYQVMQEAGIWPLPQLAQKRNVFWTESLERSRTVVSAQTPATNLATNVATNLATNLAQNSNPISTQTSTQTLTQSAEPASIDLANPLATVSKALAEEIWFEAGIPVQNSADLTTHQIDFPEAGYRVIVHPWPIDNVSNASSEPSFEPLTEPLAPISPEGMGEDQHIAIVLDSSYSMTAHGPALTKNLDWLKSHQNSNEFDAYIAISGDIPSEKVVDLARLNVEKIQFYGTLQLSEMLNTFAQLQDDEVYDAIVILTDAGTYELAQDSPDLPKIPMPLWIVHLDGQLPPAYEDTVLQTIQASHGGVATDLQTALQRLAIESRSGATQRGTQPQTQIVSLVDGYLWQVEPLGDETIGQDLHETIGQDHDLGTNDRQGNLVESALKDSEREDSEREDSELDEFDRQDSGRDLHLDDSFAPLAARQLILYRSREADLTQLAELDAVHAIARQAEIVSPYSSMLVLVEDRQRDALKAAEEADDRFDREVESGEEDLTQPNNPIAVPENSSIVGMAVAAIGLLYLLKRQNRRRISIS